MEPRPESEPAVQVDGVTVRFGEHCAVDDVSLAWPPGKIHAIVGQNGAGKSTLAKVIAGLQPATTGSIRVNGIDLRTGDHVGARRSGVDMVHQHSSLVPSMTVAEALEITDPVDGALRTFRAETLRRKWRDRLDGSGTDIDVGARVGDLSVEAVQSLEIARARPSPGGVLILDEPTAVLPPPSIDRLFAMLHDLKSRGISIIVVLHKLGEVRAVADTVSVLRSGQLVLEPTPAGDTTDHELAELIIGSSSAVARKAAMSEPIREQEQVGREAPVGFALRACSTAGTRHEVALEDVDIEARLGEVVGLAGVDGNGQRGVVELLCGITRPTSGSVMLRDRDITELDVRARRHLGVRVVPFDRFAEGICGGEPLWRNVAVWDAERHRRWRWLPFVSVSAMHRRTVERLERFGVAYSRPDQPAETLSGGNAQRLILAREFDGAEALVVAQPTRGLDIGGISFVWTSVRELAAAGVPVIVVSSDVDELLANCDRLYVLRGGRITFQGQAPHDRSEVGAAMTGVGG